MKQSFTLVIFGISCLFAGIYSYGTTTNQNLYFYGLTLVWIMTTGLICCLWFIIYIRVSRENELKSLANNLGVQFSNKLPREFGRRWYDLDQYINAVFDNRSQLKFAIFDLCQETGIPLHTVVRVVSNKFDLPQICIRPKINNQNLHINHQNESVDVQCSKLFDVFGDKTFFDHASENFYHLLLNNPRIIINSEKHYIDFYYQYKLLPTQRCTPLKNLAMNFVKAIDFPNKNKINGSLIC